MQKLNNIDGGNPFDWGKTSQDYAKYRDIYPDIFYQKILERGLCKDGQTVLDIGTGTGVLPRNMYRFGAKWVGTDISENQIQQAERLIFILVRRKNLNTLITHLTLSPRVSAFGIPIIK